MREVNPMDTNRATSWKLYIDAPMPMVTIFKTLDISGLIEWKAKGYKLNMLLCYCIALAANQTKEFRLLPVGRKMMEYDQIGVNVIVANRNGGINSCDLPFSPDLDAFHRSYLELTEHVHQTCCDYEIQDHMIVGTSSLIHYDVDGVVNMYSGIFNNPFLIWGKYRQEGAATKLQVSFQFHHVQMDGIEACEFLEKIQRSITHLTGK
ncbi:MAG: CatA-like O-acetyltransferase, family 2 [Eubacteriales bacterium]|nr:CatA-like O-acetyltransferase, family 2 [Eubacteriales bacterium]